MVYQWYCNGTAMVFQLYSNGTALLQYNGLRTSKKKLAIKDVKPSKIKIAFAMWSDTLM